MRHLVPEKPEQNRGLCDSSPRARGGVVASALAVRWAGRGCLMRGEHLPIHDDVPARERGRVPGGRCPADVQNQLDVGVRPIQDSRFQVNRLAEVSHHGVLPVPVRPQVGVI